MLRKSVDLIVAINARGSVVTRTSVRTGSLEDTGRRVNQIERVGTNWPFGIKIFSMVGHVLNQMVSADFHGEVCLIIPENLVITGYQIQKLLKFEKSARATCDGLKKSWMDDSWCEVMNYVGKSAWHAAKNGIRVEFYPDRALWFTRVLGADPTWINREVEFVRGVNEEFGLSLDLMTMSDCVGTILDNGYRDRHGSWKHKFEIQRPQETISEVVSLAREVWHANNEKLPIGSKEMILGQAF